MSITIDKKADIFDFGIPGNSFVFDGGIVGLTGRLVGKDYGRSF